MATCPPLSATTSVMAAPPVPPDVAMTARWPFARDDRPSKIVCVGRNYALHAQELGNVVPDKPMLFLKPPSSLLASGEPIVLPKGIGPVHYEVELGVVIGKRLRHVDAATAAAGIGGWCLAMDLTARQLQDQAKAKGTPWAVAKGYDGFCPISGRLPAAEVDPADARLQLVVNGATKQDGSTKDMIWKVPDLLAFISSIMTLEPGDLVLTGTPHGVGPLAAGDKVEGRLDGATLLTHHVVAA